MARTYDDRVLTEKELTVAREHPRGTEQRTLGPYRSALNDLDAYAALPEREPPRIEAANLLGMGRNTITRKIAELGIEDDAEHNKSGTDAETT